jgi:hypothetical protein
MPSGTPEFFCSFADIKSSYQVLITWQLSSSLNVLIGRYYIHHKSKIAVPVPSLAALYLNSAREFDSLSWIKGFHNCLVKIPTRTKYHRSSHTRNTSHTQNSHWSKSIRLSIKSDTCGHYAINNFQSECWFYTGCVKIKVIELQRAIVSELLLMNEISSSSERSGF